MPETGAVDPDTGLMGPEDPATGYWNQRGSRRQGGTVWVSLSGQE